MTGFVIGAEGEYEISSPGNCSGDAFSLETMLWSDDPRSTQESCQQRSTQLYESLTDPPQASLWLDLECHRKFEVRIYHVAFDIT